MPSFKLCTYYAANNILRIVVYLPICSHFQKGFVKRETDMCTHVLQYLKRCKQTI
jgi:hypothetical protein